MTPDFVLLKHTCVCATSLIQGLSASGRHVITTYTCLCNYALLAEPTNRSFLVTLKNTSAEPLRDNKCTNITEKHRLRYIVASAPCFCNTRAAQPEDNPGNSERDHGFLAYATHMCVCVRVCVCVRARSN